MTSPRYRELSRRVGELRSHLLPRNFDPTGSYADRIYERARAFRVLTHAEFESFIEDRSLELINAAFSNWKSSGKVAPCLLALVAYKESSHAIPESLKEANARRNKFLDLEARIEAAKNDFNRYVRTQNNGIKEKNLLRILMPLGFVESEINPAWLSMTDAWATERGDAAHQTAKMQVQPDPQKELRIVKEIRDGFKELDMQMKSK